MYARLVCRNSCIFTLREDRRYTKLLVCVAMLFSQDAIRYGFACIRSRIASFERKEDRPPSPLANGKESRLSTRRIGTLYGIANKLAHVFLILYTRILKNKFLFYMFAVYYVSLSCFYWLYLYTSLYRDII